MYIVCTSAIEALDKGASINHLKGSDCLAFVSTLAQFLTSHTICQPYTEVIFLLRLITTQETS